MTENKTRYSRGGQGLYKSINGVIVDRVAFDEARACKIVAEIGDCRFPEITQAEYEDWTPKRPAVPVVCDHTFVGKDMLCQKCGKYFPEINEEPVKAVTMRRCSLCDCEMAEDFAYCSACWDKLCKPVSL